MKILIAGDSFAANWQIKYPEKRGWPNLLAQDHDITNVAQAGCGEYKILKQIKSQNLQEYDITIISHTSPYRLYVKEHPIHKNDLLHCNSDFIYADTVEHKLTDVADFYKKYFDTDHAKDMHWLICKEINYVTLAHNTIHITHSEWNDLFLFSDLIDFTQLHKKSNGFTNHYSDAGNKAVYNELKSRLSSI